MYSLNTQSGMLHLEDHGGGTNAESFDRADQADKFMFDSGKTMQFCKTCFPDNKNAADDTTATATATDTDEDAAGSPTEFTTRRGTTPPELRDTDTDDEA